MYDILIVGGGPAGLTAAIYARRAGKSVLVVEGSGLGGQILSSPLVENWPGQAAVRQVKAAEPIEGGFMLTAGRKSFEGRALILCTGAKHRHLGLPREEELVGRGVSYCATCDGAFYAGGETAVAGGGDSALQSALYLSGICKTVYLIHRREEFRGSEILEGEDKLTGLVLRDVTTGETEPLAVPGLFVAVGQAPENTPFAPLAELDESGYFIAGEDCRTRTPGVFVAGDCRAKSLRQLTTAAADGSVAATAACQWLDGQ